MQKINNGDSGLIAANKIYDNDLQAVLQWKAEDYPINTIVFNAGRFYKNNAAAVSTDVPGSAAKWVKINTMDLDVEGGALSFSVAKALLGGFMNPDTSTPIATITVPSSAVITGGHFLRTDNTYNNDTAYPNAGVVYNFPVGNATVLKTTGIFNLNPGTQFAAITGRKKNGTAGVLMPQGDPNSAAPHTFNITDYETISFQVWAPEPFPTVELVEYPQALTDVKKYIDGQLKVLDFFLNPTQTIWQPLAMPQPGELPDAIINTAFQQYPTPGAAGNGTIVIADMIPDDFTLLKISGNFSVGGGGTMWLGGMRQPTTYTKLFSGVQSSGSHIFEIDRVKYNEYLYSRFYNNQTYEIGKTIKLPITIDSVKEYIDNHISGGSVISNETKAQINRPRKVVRIEFTTADPIPTVKGVFAGGTVVYTDMEGLGLKKFATIEVQGATSAGYEKRNYTIAMYNDEARTSEFKLRVGNWVEHSELVYKANWIDATHARNLISNSIWEDIVQSRPGYPKRENEKAYVAGDTAQLGRFDSGALCHVDGIPCEFWINGGFYGIGTLNMGKKRDNYDLKSGTQNHIQLAAETHANFNTYVAAEWEIRNPKTPDANFLTKINAWFAANALTGQAFKDAFPTNHDVNNAVDFFLLAEFIQSPDMYTKNLMLTSWNGTKFYFLPYDMDTTFGLQWDGASFTGWTTSIRSASFWNKFYAAYTAEIKARYADLKAKGVFTVNNVYKHADLINKTFGLGSYQKEQAAWPNIPSNSTIYTGFPQLYDWTKNRIVWLDSQYS